jgi:hypothetical protein
MPAHRKPLETLIASGATDHDPQRYRNRQPEPKSDEPLGNPPTSLNAEEKKIWREVAKHAIPGTLTGSDRVTMELLSRLILKMRVGTAKSGDHGTMLSLLARLGMTPADRLKVQAAKSAEKQPTHDEWSFIQRKSSAVRPTGSQRPDFGLQVDSPSVQ